MRLLLDTHTFIWWDSNADRLTARVRGLIQDKANTLLLSVASIWEMQIKLRAGKITFKTPLADTIKHHQEENRIQPLPVTLDHVMMLEQMPDHHKDPFDRLIIAQAMSEKISILGNDSKFAQYQITVIW